jgi:putative MFS transporter
VKFIAANLPRAVRHDLAVDEEPVGPLGFTTTEWRIVAPLSFAAFFENYDYALLSVAAPVLSDGLRVSESRFGVAVSIIRVFGLASIVLVRLADRVGRRRMLLATLVGFAAFTGLTAGAWSLASFVVAGALARLFLTSEGALSGLVIAEEVHPARRGRALSFAGLLGQTAFGAVAVLVALQHSLPLGWRFLYLAALAALGLVATLRRRLPETAAFRTAERDQRIGAQRIGVLDGPWRTRALVCAAVFGLVGAFQTAAGYHSAQLAQNTYGWTGKYTLVIVLSGPFVLAGFLLGGRGSDRWGRRPVLGVGIALQAAGMAIVFAGSEGGLAPGWFAFVLGQAMIAGCWLAFVGELVPTEVRATVTAMVVAVQVAAGSAGLAVSSLLGSTPLASGRVAVWIGLASVLSLGAFAVLPESSGRDMVSPYAPAGRLDEA